MEVIKKKSAKLFEFKVNNIGGAEVIEHKFENGSWVAILYGKNGAGKSSAITGIYLALKGKKGVPGKTDNFVGPYNTKGKNKGVVDLRIKAEPGVTELGEDLFIHFTIQENGNTSLRITDEKTGTIHTTAPLDKVRKLLGMFQDPVELKKTLDDPHGDRNLAEKICAMAGLDLNPFVELEAQLFAEFQSENVEKKRQEGVFATLEEPQEDWAKHHTDPAGISDSLQSVELLKSQNEQKVRNIIEEYNSNDRLCESSVAIWDQILITRKEGKSLQEAYNLQVKSLNDKKESFETLKKTNKPDEWEGTNDIEDKIKKLTEELVKLKDHEQAELKKKQDIETVQKEIEIDKEKLSSSAKELSDKREVLSKSTSDKAVIDLSVTESSKKIDQIHIDNEFEKWAGETDPGGKMFPSVYLSDKMANVTKWNKQFTDREAYEKAENGLKSIDASIQSISKKRKDNQTAKSNAVASVKDKFPHPGITVDENTVWVDLDDRRGKRTINDLSEGEKLMICCHILIAGNTGALDILVVRDGSSLDEDNKNVIYNIAKEHGYTVILETIETSEAGALHIVDGRVDSINQPLIKEKPVETAEVPGEPVKKEVDDSEFNWE